ncbi:MAG: NHL repeat-containing protein [Acidobacteriaceae bacterium]
MTMPAQFSPTIYRNATHSSSLKHRILAVLAATLAVSSLIGCAANFNAVTPVAFNGMALKGNVHGGQQPLTGANIYLFAAGTSGYASASNSLLDKSNPAVSTDGNGNGFVLTDSGGNFTITGDWVCANATDQLYILVAGGNPGLAPGTNNTAISMMSALGTCSGINASTFVVVNELSTIAAVTSLQQFMSGGLHVGSSATNAVGIANAFTTSSNMVPIVGPLANSVTPGGNGTVPQSTLHTLANILSACVNTAGGTSAQCVSLFSNAQPSGGTLPTDTLTAALDIALNPTNNVAALFALSPATPPFQPSLAQAPNDWTVGINYTIGSGTPLPGYLAIDGNNNVWISNLASNKAVPGTDSIIKLDPFGNILSGTTGFTDGGFVKKPQGLALDDQGNVWVASGTSSVLRMTSAGVDTTAFPLFGANHPQGIALDKSGNAWVSNFGSGGSGTTATRIGTDGTILQAGISSPGFAGPQGVALDSNGDIWVAGQTSNSLLKISGTDGSILSGSGSGFQDGLDGPTGVAIDGSNRVWVIDDGFGNGTTFVSLFNNDGTAASPPGGFSTVNTGGFENLVVIDGAGTAWTPTCGVVCFGPGASDNVIHLAKDGSLLNTANGFKTPGLNAPQGVGIDASGNLWVGNTAGNATTTPGTITEIVGVAAPVMSPIQAALKANKLGQRP